MSKEARICVIHPHAEKIYANFNASLGGAVNFIIDNAAPQYVVGTEHIYSDPRYFKQFAAVNKPETVSIFFAGECVAPDMNIFDYAVVFDDGLVWDDRVIRMPCTQFYATSIFGDFDERIGDPAQVLAEKKRFCNFVYANSQAHPMRDALFYKLSKYKRVDSLGPHMNNQGNTPSNSHSDWRKLSVEMRRAYKFSIASENATYNGYTSEKILAAFQARTIPIYWGNPHVAKEFNPAAFINCHDYAGLDDIVEAVKTVDNDDALWRGMLGEPRRTPAQIEKFNKESTAYREFLLKVFTLAPRDAKRTGQGFHPERYRTSWQTRATAARSPEPVIPEPVISEKDFAHLVRKKVRGTTFEEKLAHISYQFFHLNGYPLNIAHPRSFNEKIQWLKLFYRNPLLTRCADKYKVREYVAKKIGEEFLVPVVAAYDSPEEIDLSALPEQFALKMNWGSGQNIICRNKSGLTPQKVKETVRTWFRPENNHYFYSFEWCYKNVTPKAICEKYIEQHDGKLIDYKFFCYNGKMRNMFCAVDRFADMRFNFYDRDFNQLPFYRYYKNADRPVAKPEQFEMMTELSEKLAAPFPFVRVDFYEINQTIFFGELTFYPGNGMEPFTPREWDFRLGEMIELPEI